MSMSCKMPSRYFKCSKQILFHSRYPPVLYRKIYLSKFAVNMFCDISFRGMKNILNAFWGADWRLLRLNCCGFVAGEGYGGLLSVYVVVHGAVALVLIADSDVHAEGEAHLKLVHALFGLVSVDGRPYVFGPVRVDGVWIVVEEENVVKVLLR